MTVILALSLLDAAMLQGQKRPVPRTNALRLALSYLHQRAGGDPAPFRAFWRLCADPLPWAENDSIRCIIRASEDRARSKAEGKGKALDDTPKTWGYRRFFVLANPQIS